MLYASEALILQEEKEYLTLVLQITSLVEASITVFF